LVLKTDGTSDMGDSEASPLNQPACPVQVGRLRVQEAVFEKLVLKTGGTSDMGDSGVSFDPASMSSPGKKS
jgi:hypothetical protein